MDKRLVIVIGLIIFLLGVVAYFYLKQPAYYLTYDKIPSIPEYLKLFENCKSIENISIDQRTEKQKLCPEEIPSDLDILKLKLLKDYKGDPINLTEEGLEDRANILDYVVWRILFNTKNVEGEDVINKVGVYQLNNKTHIELETGYFIITKRPIIYTKSEFSKINLDEETINKLREK
ncbi:MAG: hypothetical protein AABX48_04545 [Nanoarchaeota archaeon]